MSEKTIRELLKSSGAVVSGHFRLSSDERHGTTYINKNLVMLKAADLFVIASEIAAKFSAKNIQAVVGPATGGIGLAAVTAVSLIQLGTRDDVMWGYAEKSEADSDVFEFGRGFAEHLKGRRILVVEDILTTGTSGRSVVDAARTVGGNVVGFSAIVNRGGITSKDLGHPGTFSPLLSMTLPTFAPDECPECLAGTPLSTTLGDTRPNARKSGKGSFG